MKTRLVPRTDLTALVLCLGTAEFGSALDESSSEKILETYLDAGGIGPKKSADLLESIEAAKTTLSPENVAFLTGQHRFCCQVVTKFDPNWRESGLEGRWYLWRDGKTRMI